MFLGFLKDPLTRALLITQRSQQYEFLQDFSPKETPLTFSLVWSFSLVTSREACFPKFLVLVSPATIKVSIFCTYWFKDIHIKQLGNIKWEGFM